MKNLILLLFLILTRIYVSAQIPINETRPGKTTTVAPLRQHNILLQQAKYAENPKISTARTTGTGPVFDTSKWNHKVDSTWGTGLSDTDKLNVLNTFWGHVDSLYPCFVHLPNYNWDSIVNSMRTQIAAGVSEGKFAEMINYLLSLMNDGHSNFYDYTVDYPTSIYQGLPVFRGESGLIGACITTLNDTSAMVYDAFPGHPLGLQPGDIILGYNGIPWTKLVKIILGYNLPNTVYKGSTDSATFHRYIQAAGENWYLFDTINIKKCNGTIVNLPTSLMAGKYYRDFCTEQMTVPGVNKATYFGYYDYDSSVIYGVLSGTHIGYVYMYDCEDTGAKLYNATKTLVEDSMVTGLIYDIRTNFGGGFNAYWTTYEYLTSGGTSWVGYGERSDPTNRLAMYNDGLSSWYDIYDDDPNYFNHPIAILCGPNAVSAGDFMPVMFKHNPQVKLFGKSTAGAFGSLEPIDVGNSNFIASMQQVNFFQTSDTSFYLSHTMFPVDFPVWFNKDSVCAGKDNIVSKAVQWINSTEEVKATALHTPTITIFPNPAYQYINIAISSPDNDHLNIKLCNMFGIVVKEINSDIVTGDNAIKMDIAGSGGVATGNYLLYIQGNNGDRIIKKVSIVR